MDNDRLSLPAILGSVLFAAVRPLSVKQLAEIAGETEARVEEALAELGNSFKEEVFGVSLVEVGNRWQLRTSPKAKDAIEKLIPNSARRLSRAAAETLAVVAYKQPVQKAEIDAIRGVDSFPTLKTLIEARLVRVIGHDDRPGQPALYATTQKFLEKFGLKDLNDLPNIREVQRIVEDPGETMDDDVADEDDVDLAEQSL